MFSEIAEEERSMGNCMAEILEDGIDKLEYYCNRIDDAINQFCVEEEIDDLKSETQNVFNACIKYIYKMVFKPVDKSLLRDSKCNSVIDYNDIDLLKGILEYYIYICDKYSKAVNVISFGNLIGLSRSVLYDWSNGDVRKLNSEFSDIYKILDAERERTLSDLLISGKKQPIGLLAVLNHEKGWNLPGSSREVVHISAKEDAKAIADRYKAVLTDSKMSDDSEANG